MKWYITETIPIKRRPWEMMIHIENEWNDNDTKRIGYIMKMKRIRRRKEHKEINRIKKK